jgi:acyl carrier protein
VSAIIEQLLERLDKPHQDLTDETHLYGEGLGLDSLETAELSATFEDQFGSDPFSAGGRMPQTVGDIMAFYGATSDL